MVRYSSFEPVNNQLKKRSYCMKAPEKTRVKKETITDIIMFVLLALAVWILIIIL